MNLNPGSKRCAQNHGTSGIETRRPAKAKMLAIQRMASFCSLGIKMSRRAPASGVNKMIERIWLCIFSSKPVWRGHSCPRRVYRQA